MPTSAVAMRELISAAAVADEVPAGHAAMAVMTRPVTMTPVSVEGTGCGTGGRCRHQHQDASNGECGANHERILHLRRSFCTSSAVY